MHFPPRKMLVPTDLTETSEPALAFTRMIYERFDGAVHVMHVHQFDVPPYFTSEQSQQLRAGIADAVAGAVEFLRAQSEPLLGFPAEFSVAEGTPVETILRAAASTEIELIVMGTHGRHGVDRFWLGSVAEQVLRQSPKPVLAVRHGMRPSFLQHVLCPVTDSVVSRTALEYAATLTEAADGRLTVIHALERGTRPPEGVLVPETIRGRCQVEELTYHGDAPGAILTAARERRTDVIVMGGERKTSAFGAFFSSTTERVMQWAQAPLIVVPAQC